jgi:DNA polymerase III sliding clamp (beta) subunit (PCNA family)
MKNPFSKIFKTSSKTIPEKVLEELDHHFPNAFNVEWEMKRGSYEAIFYVDEVEHIAHISAEGKLEEYKRNLWPNELPEKITKECNQLGETMNAIAIFRNGKKFFEVIIRDTKFKRKLFLFEESATLVDSRKL